MASLANIILWIKIGKGTLKCKKLTQMPVTYFFWQKCFGDVY